MAQAARRIQRPRPTRSVQQERPEWWLFYQTKEWKSLRLQIGERDNWICADCGRPGNNIDHIVDHKGNYELQRDPNNLCVRCQSCHSRKTMRDNGCRIRGTGEG